MQVNLETNSGDHGDRLVELAGAMLAAMQAGQSDRLCRLIAERAAVIAAVQQAGTSLDVDPADAEVIIRADGAAQSYLNSRLQQVKEELVAVRSWRAALPGYRAGRAHEPRFVDRRG